MPTNSYDLVVIGDSFPGLVTATLCAKRGMRVLLASQGASPESYRLGPYDLPVRALPLTGLESPAALRVVGELNFTHLLRRRLQEYTPSFQFVAPNVRLDITDDNIALGRQLTRELVGNGAAEASELVGRFDASGLGLDAVMTLDAAFPATGFRSRREVSRAIEAVVAPEIPDGINPAVRALLAGPAAISSGTLDPITSDIARARALHTWRRGVARLEGGWQELHDIFRDKFASHGGEVREIWPEEITTSWGKANGLRTRGGETIGAEQLVAALPVDQLVDLMPKPPKRLVQMSESLSPVGYRYTLNLVLDEAGLPEGMGANVLVVTDPDKPLVGDNAFALYVAPPDDEARIHVVIEATCPKPDGSGSLDEALADLRVRLRERLEEVMPFSRDHVLCAHSPHESVEAEGLSDELAAIAEPVPLWPALPDAPLGLSAASYGVGLKRLTLANDQILPGLGIEGAFLTGWCAAAVASGGKRKDFLKDEFVTSAQ